MREIKVRAYEPVNQIMFFYNEMDGRETMQFYIDAGIVKAQVVVAPEDESDDPFGYKHFPCEVMQFTGLLDKNGKEIWEGDVVKITTTGISWGKEYAWTGEVIFSRGAFVVKSKDGKKDKFTMMAPDRPVEVLGNIHENRDLIHQQPT